MTLLERYMLSLSLSLSHISLYALHFLQALDKVARLLRIECGAKSAGEALEAVAECALTSHSHSNSLIHCHCRQGNPKSFAFNSPMSHVKSCDFSFSGLKTAALR
jgi:tRNA A37 threonylcarbamoyltransferase TsaD